MRRAGRRSTRRTSPLRSRTETLRVRGWTSRRLSLFRPTRPSSPSPTASSSPISGVRRWRRARRWPPWPPPTLSPSLPGTRCRSRPNSKQSNAEGSKHRFFVTEHDRGKRRFSAGRRAGRGAFAAPLSLSRVGQPGERCGGGFLVLVLALSTSEGSRCGDPSAGDAACLNVRERPSSVRGERHDRSLERRRRRASRGEELYTALGPESDRTEGAAWPTSTAHHRSRTSSEKSTLLRGLRDADPRAHSARSPPRDHIETRTFAAT
mmetsp:Transcript_32001/g.75984  ORF Transcript_32001/g.75984 Transcript_32001/m.75984 type:complete len:264 (+) Transcript_32001:881-1672(+)